MPPFEPVAVNVTGMPVHTGFDEADTETFTGRSVLTTIVIWLDIAGLFAAQTRLEVNWQVTISPLRGVYEYVGEFRPTLTPFTFHS